MHVFKKTFKNARANTHASSSPIFNLKIKTVISFQVIIFNFRLKKANYISVYKVNIHVCGFFFLQFTKYHYRVQNEIPGWHAKVLLQPDAEVLGGEPDQTGELWGDSEETADDRPKNEIILMECKETIWTTYENVQMEKWHV